MYDAIEYRSRGEAVADELAEWAGVPVYNGLTDEWHPTRMLAEFLTTGEHVDNPSRIWRSAISATPVPTWPTAASWSGEAGHGRPDRRAGVAVAGAGPSRVGSSWSCRTRSTLGGWR
jgi:hypothetical protein